MSEEVKVLCLHWMREVLGVVWLFGGGVVVVVVVGACCFLVSCRG